ncbi:MAG: sulfate reduction electron transfer complex DsrMKJOP subunit DsrJ [Nitrospirae bacterium]|nr:sulfate reduction electron transfer complex DsrMKJOP subunit DsrJ [Nitrospirota bacterium]
MYNGGKIIAGLIVFVAFFAFPFYYNLGRANARPEPKLNTPVIMGLAEKKCVESRDFMRAEHMQLLNDWRDSVVRDNNRIYSNAEGKKFNISLQNTCMDCHSNKKEFCDRCHNYMAVKPYCFSCHIEPKEDKS